MSLDRSGRARSVDEQDAENLAAAQGLGAELVATYADPNVSASRFTRKARADYERLVGDIEAGRLDILILWESSRGSRRVSEWVALLEVCEAHGVRIYVTSHHRLYDPAVPRDRRSLLEDAVDSDYESGKTSTRVRRSRASSAAAGRPVGSIPYGYRREYAPGSASPLRQVPDPETGPVVQEIVARVLDGEGLHRIAVDLNRRGVPTPQMVRDRRTGTVPERPRGGWNNPKLRKLLSSPTMAGWRVHHGERFGKADWEPLVSTADHAAAWALVNAPERRTQRGTVPKYLLSGIAECGVCSGWLRRFPNRGHQSYGCAGINNTNDGHVVRLADPLDALVVTATVEALRNPELLALAARQDAASAQGVEAATLELKRLKSQLAEYESQAVTVGPAAASFARVVVGLHAEIEVATERLAAVHTLPRAVIDAAGPNADSTWREHRDDIVWQRLMVRSLLRVQVFRSRNPRGRQVFDGETVTITPRWLVAAEG